VKNVLLTVIC